MSVISSLILPQLMLWRGTFAVSSPAEDTFSFFFHCDGRTFKGQVEIGELNERGIVVVIQLYFNLFGEGLDPELIKERIKEISSDSSLKIGDDDRIVFKMTTGKPHLAAIGIMEHANKNHLDRFKNLTIGLTSAVEKFCPILLGS